uniref:DDE-1 domain-containing protein n=1 Tax=Ditylenchus dipsaci TaxID=166011 RepID=A0A915DVJ3_9BILA
MLTGRSDGYKCQPYVLLPRKRVDQAIVVDPAIFLKYLLVWDSFRCHISEATKKQLKQCELETAVVPGGCTKFVQAPDLCWNSSFKVKIREFYEDWMLHGEKGVTKRWNPKATPMSVYLQWIVEAWGSLSNELISESLKSCDITNSTDG